MKDKKIIKKPNKNKKEKYAQEFYKQIVESRKTKKYETGNTSSN